MSSANSFNHWLILLHVLICHIAGDIKLNIYNNSVHYGAPMETITLDSLNYTFPPKYNTQTFSAEIEGTLQWLSNVDLYYFICDYSSHVFGFVWIDDHCICGPQIYAPPQFINWNLTWTSSAYNQRESFLRMHIFHNYDNSNKEQIQLKDDNLNFQLLWSFTNNNSLNIVNTTYLSPVINPLQKRRILLQKDLINNTFSTYYVHNMLSIVRFPDSFGFIFGICSDKVTNKCLMSTVPQNNYLFVGSHSNNHSYFEYNLTWKNITFQYKYAQLIYNQTYSNLYVSISLLSDVIDNHYPYIGTTQQFYWNKTGTATVKQSKLSSFLNCFVDMTGYGLSQHWSLCTNTNITTANGDIQYFQFDNNMKTIYFTTDIFNSVNDKNYISKVISNEEMIEYNTYKKYGNLSETKRAIQAGLLWNWIYTPEEVGAFAQVARSWTSGNNDYQFVLFDWDNIFASYMLSLDLTSLNLSISNMIQEIKAKTVHGFIPNMKEVKLPYLMDAEDRTEPIIGSYVLLQMYKKYKNNVEAKELLTFVIDFLFNDLLDWINWMWIRRRCVDYYLICLGSGPNEPLVKDSHNTMGSARLESGLDNSPMYDGNFYDNVTHHMLLYDVGMSSLYSSEIKSFIQLANIINYNDSSLVSEMKSRYQFITNGISKYLWNSTMKIFINKRSDTDEFYVKISPTSFYALLTLDISNNTDNITMYDIELMISNYLLSQKYFCIDKNSSDWPANQASDCYYGLPSISKADPAFKQQNYWRGLSWGPMVQLVWWSLEEYVDNNNLININNTHYKFIKNAQSSLEFQMNKMMLNIWNKKRHICENFSPGESATECTGHEFYHWGGLAGFVSLINPYYNT